MSYAIAIRWVHIDGQRTHYSDVVEEAATLRGQLAAARAHALALGELAPPVPDLPDLTDLKGEDALLEWVQWARRELPALQNRIDDAAHHALTRRLGATLPPPSTRPGAVAELARRRATPNPTAPAAGQQDVAGQRDTAVTAARRLIADNAAQIDPAEHPHIAALLDELTEATTRPTVRAARHAVEVAVHTAVARHRDRLAREAHREQLRAHTTHLDPDQRRALLHAIDTATDPATVADRVHAAATAAQARHARDDVARAATAALAEIGCDVTSHADTQLTHTGETVVNLPERPGYGIRVRLPTTDALISTSLVRYPDTPADADVATQQWFCATKHPLLRHRLTHHAGQTQLHETIRREPGDRPLPVTPPPAATPEATTHTDTPHLRHRTR